MTTDRTGAEILDFGGFDSSSVFANANNNKNKNKSKIKSKNNNNNCGLVY